MSLRNKMNHVDSRVLAQSCEKFSIDVYKKAASEVQNSLVCSPIGAHLVLSMAAYGAEGNTRMQMIKGLRLSENNSIDLTGFKSLIDELNNNSGIELKVASKIFLSHESDVKSEYTSAMENYFSSTCDVLDFSKKAESSKIINDWCSKSTNDHIKQIVDEDDLSGDTEMLLVNTIYFKSEWKLWFDRMNTEWGPFYLNETETKNLAFMHQKERFFYGELENVDAKFVELPYTDESSRMIVIVPNQINGLSEIEQNLDKINIESLAALREKPEVTVILPKFKIENKIDLKECLDKMGMTDMFRDAANFRKITEQKNVKISKIFQKSYILVDEIGTAATAITNVKVTLKCRYKGPPKMIRADRPFMMIIVKDETPLFYAKFTGY